MTRQLDLGFEDGKHVQAAIHNVEQAVADMIEVITAKEAAWRLNVTPSVLHKKLNREERNQLSGRELVLLIVTAPPAQRRAILDVLVGACGFAVDDRPELPPAVVLERLESLLDDEIAPQKKAALLRKARGR